MAPKLKQGMPASNGLFSGLRFCFLVKSHTQLMMKRVQGMGGQLSDNISPETTHIVCRLEIEQFKLLEALPSGSSLDCYQLVTQQFIAQSILQNKLQDEKDFRPKILSPKAEKSTSAHDAMAPPPSKRLKPSVERPLDIPAPAAPKLKYAISTSFPTYRGETGAEEAQPPSPAEPCCVERRGSEFVCIGGQKPSFTGGHTGIPWGSFGVWDEPYDEPAARKTIEILRKYWYVNKESARPLIGGDHTYGDGSSEEEDVLGGGGPGSSSGCNGVCSHVACSKRPYCLVQKLEEVKKIYLEGRDQFKIKAIDKSQQQLIMHSRPLETEEDVDAVGLGTKSAIKVKEILGTGRLKRVEAAAGDERTRAYSQFLEVWGVGAGVAERWFRAGCRTLDDVRLKVEAGEIHLTEQQRVGMKYFNDFAGKIPRDQIAVAESIVRTAAFELVESLGASDPERTYCFATGSYRRGKPESSDVDILIVLPPGLRNPHCGEFMNSLLTRLMDRGLLVDEMGPKEPHAHGHTSRASWMGVCQIPGHSTYRRIDFKVYSAEHAVPAVNYFANSQAFCRATRFWANNAVPGAAKAVNAVATGFKISDLEMVPMVRRKKGERGAGGGRHGGTGEETAVLGPQIELRSETDLYEKIGLAYVPVTMRYFHDFF